MMWRMCGTAVALSAGLALSGCANQQKAELYLVLDASAQHPEVAKAGACWLLAETLAALRLTAAQAEELRAWAEADGAKVRDDLDKTMVRVGRQAHTVRLAAVEVVALGAVGHKARAEITRRHGLDPADPTRYSEALAPNGLPKDLLAPESLSRLQPTVEALSEEQRCIAGGGWLDAVRAVADLQAARTAEVAAKRAALVEKIRGIWILPHLLSGQVEHRLQVAVDQIGADGAQPEPECVVRELLELLPGMPKPVQVQVATRALGALLSLDAAPDLLRSLH